MKNLICKFFGHDYPLISPDFATRSAKETLFREKNTCCRCRDFDETSYNSQMAKYDNDVKELTATIAGAQA